MKAAEAGLSPLEYMLAVMRDETVEAERRDRMAIAAAPYIHPRIAPSSSDGADGAVTTIIMSPMDAAL